jgi:hypothetical protein
MKFIKLIGQEFTGNAPLRKLFPVNQSSPKDIYEAVLPFILNHLEQAKDAKGKDAVGTFLPLTNHKPNNP